MSSPPACTVKTATDVGIAMTVIVTTTITIIAVMNATTATRVAAVGEIADPGG